MNYPPILHVAVSLVAAPFLFGVINKVKAFFAGRKGPPLLQLYYDIVKLMRKGAVYSRTTTEMFRLSPLASVAVGVLAVMTVPLGQQESLISFHGDIFLLAYLFGLARFTTVLAAMDTGSAFEGMGASREVQFSMLAEPALLVGLAALSLLTSESSVAGILASLRTDLGTSSSHVVLPICVASLFIVLLAENARIPVDDPNTHLELTMIHEVMVLDHGGMDLGLIHYGSALKLWVFSSIIARVLIPVQMPTPLLDALLAAGALLLVTVAVGVVESSMARLRMLRVPQLLTGATILSLVALIIAMR
jgi:formate hydrogenlyase subunit 4